LRSRRKSKTESVPQLTKSGKEIPKENEIKLEIEALHLNYDAWVKQEENLSGVLNTKTLSLKNIELKEKI